jgi:FkbM family methyltransferase
MAEISALTGLARSIAIYYGQPWKRRGLRRFYAGLLKPGDLVFDVGAHVGSRTRLFHGLGCKVVALEPQPLFHRFLAKTLPNGVTLLRQAVAAEPGRMMLNVSSRHPTVSTLSSDWIGKVRGDAGFGGVDWDDRVEVTVTTLDQLIAAHGRPAFAKIDVEGMEAAILKGLSQPLPLLAVEYLPAALDVAFACVDRLSHLGSYLFNAVEGEAAGFAWPDWLDVTATKAALEGAARNGRSGDLYARLVDP